MTAPATLATVLDRAGEELGGFLPRLGGALLLLVVGILAARLICRFLKSALNRVGLDTAAERWDVSRVLDRAGLGDSLSALVARAVRIALSLVIVFAALSLLGLQFLSESLNQAVLFLPKALAAMGLLLAGVVLGGWLASAWTTCRARWTLPCLWARWPRGRWWRSSRSRPPPKSRCPQRS